MNPLGSPYNFVPLSPFILRPDWAAQVSHDHPFADGVSGDLSIELKAHSPLCIGGQQTASSADNPAQVYFYRTPDGKLAIPGTSLKGMLRNVLAIAGFGHFRQVQDKRLGVRDISRADNFYSKQMNQSQVYSGWLQFVNGSWQLTPCQRHYVRIHHTDIIRCFGIRESEWLDSKNQSAIEKLVEGPLQKIRFDIQSYKYDCKEEAHNVGRCEHEAEHEHEHEHEAYLVITGQPGKGFKDKSGKKREFLFAAPGDETQRVSHGVMADFMLIHEDSKEWTFWRQRVAQLSPGIPVFFHYDTQKQVKSLGLARMYRLAYEHSLHEAIRHTQPGHIDDNAPDLADLLFGQLDLEGGSLRGRVGIETALLNGESATSRTAATVLNTPKPTFYPAYVRQKASGDYKTLMDQDAELAGWKRYPLRERYDITMPSLNSKVEANRKVQVQLETLPMGSTFSGRIHMHNLRLCELGALLWVLDFGARSAHHHSLGTGKPLGFGQVSLTLTRASLRLNQTTPASDDELLAAARVAFHDMMNTSWRAATGSADANWEESEQVQQLLAMTDPAVSPPLTQPLVYPEEPKAFADAKKRDENWRLLPYEAPDQITRAPRQAGLVETGTGNVDIQSLLAKGKVQLAEHEDRQRGQQAREQRREEKADMTEAERALADIADGLEQAQTQGLSKTIEGNMAKGFLQALTLAANEDTPYQEQLQELAKRGQTLVENFGKAKGKLDKAIRKVLR